MFLNIGNITVSYTNCHNFTTERFSKPIVNFQPCN